LGKCFQDIRFELNIKDKVGIVQAEKRSKTILEGIFAGM
jgi:hypothetical protein